MLQNVFANLLSRPATRRFPAARREPPAGVRGTVDFSIDNCAFCGACALRCPTGAIGVDRPTKTLTFDVFRCVVCGCCEEACKKDGVHMVRAYHAPVLEQAVVVYRAPGAAAASGSGEE